MDATYVQPGSTIDHTPSAAVDAGDVIVLGNLIGIAKNDIAASELASVAIGGVFDFTKSGSTGPVFAVGEDVFWDTVNSLAVKVGGAGSIFVGTCVAAAGASDTTVRTRLVQSPPVPAFADKTWEAVDLTSASKTLDIEDVGKVMNVTGSATNVVTLPAIAAGLEFVIRAATDGVRLAISPNASDKFLGADLTGTDNKDRILTGATAKAGDYIHLRYGSADGYMIVAQRGVWTNEA